MRWAAEELAAAQVHDIGAAALRTKEPGNMPRRHGRCRFGATMAGAAARRCRSGHSLRFDILPMPSIILRPAGNE
jgi:hypothetical protein